MTNEELRRLWGIPGWSKDKHLSITIPNGEIWTNVALFAKAFLRKDPKGNVMEITIVPLR